MTRASAPILRIALLSLAIGATTSRASRAQASPAVTTHVSVTLNVPIQVKDFDPTFQNISLTCTIHPSGSTDASSSVRNDGVIEQPLDHGTFSGTIPVQFTVITQQTVTSGQQWTYSCSGYFVNHPSPGVSQVYNPGPVGQATLASGASLVAGTFAMP